MERAKRVRDEKERDESSSESEFSVGYGFEESNDAIVEARCRLPIDLVDSDVEDDSIDDLY